MSDLPTPAWNVAALAPAAERSNTSRVLIGTPSGISLYGAEPYEKNIPGGAGSGSRSGGRRRWRKAGFTRRGEGPSGALSRLAYHRPDRGARDPGDAAERQVVPRQRQKCRAIRGGVRATH